MIHNYMSKCNSAILESDKEEYMKIIVSACLLGKRCKYNGGDNYRQEVVDFCRGKEVIPVCPEIEAGMPWQQKARSRKKFRAFYFMSETEK